MITEKVVTWLNKETLKRVGVKNKSELVEQAICFVLSNEDLFTKAVRRSIDWNKQIQKAVLEKNQEEVLRLFPIDPHNVSDFDKPIRKG